MKSNLSMGIERMKDADGVPLERRGLLAARICISSVGGSAFSVEFLAERDDTFNVDTIAAAFRNLLKLVEAPR